MLAHRTHRIEVKYQEILRKGTIALLTTFGAGALFGKKNMMIAFVLVLGSNIIAKCNLRVKTVHKAIGLILIDTLILCIAFVASLNNLWAIPINLVTIFLIIYLNVSPYEQRMYKTFMMLYVFCQYNSIPIADLPGHIGMVIFTVSIIIITNYLEQGKKKSLLEPQIGEGFAILGEQLEEILQGKFDKQLQNECMNQMNELAYLIYGTSYKRYFTTYIGKVQFHFYLSISYMNLLLEEIAEEYQKKELSYQSIIYIKLLIDGINAYFIRKITRKELIELFDQYITNHEKENVPPELLELMKALRKNFIELDTLPYKQKDKVYYDWERSDLSRIQNYVKEYFRPSAMSFNFALRMAVILSLALFMAHLLGFYKMIWAIIPIMSITQPYYEDTSKRRLDRLASNVLASVLVAIIVDITQVDWITYILLIISFYMIYAYKDYYHFSLFMTIVSMCISAFDTNINVLVFYRIIYVVVGSTIVDLSSRIIPYKLEDGIEELVTKIKGLNQILEEERLSDLEESPTANRIRETIIYSAMLCQKLQLRNQSYKSQEIKELIQTNVDLAIHLGNSLLQRAD